MIPEGFTCSASIAHSLVSISLKSMEHSSLELQLILYPTKNWMLRNLVKKSHTLKKHVDIILTLEVQPLPEALGPGPWKCHAVVRHLLSNLELARANEQMYCILFVSAHSSKALEMRTSCTSYFLDVYFLLIVSDCDKQPHFQRHF